MYSRSNEALGCAGAKPGPVVGLTAALHGNELNGIPTIHRLVKRIDPEQLAGTVVGVTIANVPAYLTQQRRFPDGEDLNHAMPGKAGDNESQLYSHRLVTRIVSRFEYLIDLHTASCGRVNSLYVRANLNDEVSAKLARLVGASIIVHGAGGAAALRANAGRMGISAITLEIGDPQVFVGDIFKTSRIGIRDVLEHLGMIASDEEEAPHNAVECSHSYWLYTATDGLLTVLPELTKSVKQGDEIARLVDPWGQRLQTYRAPEDGIVIGKSSNPVASAGSRILHLGIPGQPDPS